MAIKNKLEVFKHFLVLDQTDLPPERPTLTIDSMDAFDNQLYIGTNEGTLLLYKIGKLFAVYIYIHTVEPVFTGRNNNLTCNESPVRNRTNNAMR